MGVYRRYTHPRARERLLPVLAEGAHHAEVTIQCSAHGVVLATASPSVAVTAFAGDTLKSGFAHASVAVTAQANGRDADAPDATVSQVVTASARGTSLGSASPQGEGDLVAGDGDVLTEPCEARVTISLDVFAGQTRTANVGVSVSASALGFALAPDTDGDGTAAVVVSVAAAGVVVATASIEVQAVSAASEGTTIGVPREASVEARLIASAVFLGPASAFASTDVNCDLRATGVRITGAEIGRAPAGRTIDWRSLVEGTAAAVPDYEFGHRNTKRKFFQ